MSDREDRARLAASLLTPDAAFRRRPRDDIKSSANSLTSQTRATASTISASEENSAAEWQARLEPGDGLMKLSIILATRNRPHLLVPTVRKTLANVRNKETTLVVMVDSDDEATLLCQPQLERMGAVVIPSPRALLLGSQVQRGRRDQPGRRVPRDGRLRPARHGRVR
jgi:hypothetical protein